MADDALGTIAEKEGGRGDIPKNESAIHVLCAVRSLHEEFLNLLRRCGNLWFAHLNIPFSASGSAATHMLGERNRLIPRMFFTSLQPYGPNFGHYHNACMTIGLATGTPSQ